MPVLSQHPAQAHTSEQVVGGLRQRHAPGKCTPQLYHPLAPLLLLKSKRSQGSESNGLSTLLIFLDEISSSKTLPKKTKPMNDAESTLPSTSVSRQDFLASRPDSSRRAVSMPFLQSNEAAALAYNL